MADAARKISPGDPEYAAVLAVWEHNMRAYTFDRVREDGGGAIYICPNYQTDPTPDFFVTTEAGPTVFDDNVPGDEPVTYGFIPDMLMYGGLRVMNGPRNKILIRRPLLPREPQP